MAGKSSAYFFASILVLLALLLLVMSGCIQETQEAQGNGPWMNGRGPPMGDFNRGDFNRFQGMDFNLDRMKPMLGLPQEATEAEIKQALGLGNDATEEEIMNAFREKMGEQGGFRNWREE